jgi:hypothetical protein
MENAVTPFAQPWRRKSFPFILIRVNKAAKRTLRFNIEEISFWFGTGFCKDTV